MQHTCIANDDISLRDIVPLFIDNVDSCAAADIQQLEKVIVFMKHARVNRIRGVNLARRNQARRFVLFKTGFKGWRCKTLNHGRTPFPYFKTLHLLSNSSYLYR